MVIFTMSRVKFFEGLFEASIYTLGTAVVVGWTVYMVREFTPSNMLKLTTTEPPSVIRNRNYILSERIIVKDGDHIKYEGTHFLPTQVFVNNVHY